MFITYPHLMEVLPPSVAPSVSNNLFFLDGFIYMLSPLMLLLFKDTRSLLILGSIITVASLIGLLLVKQGEGVKFLMTQRRFEEAIRETERVAAVN
jgi:hypothetical protein